jgi:hypothetical protein
VFRPEYPAFSAFHVLMMIMYRSRAELGCKGGTCCGAAADSWGQWTCRDTWRRQPAVLEGGSKVQRGPWSTVWYLTLQQCLKGVEQNFIKCGLCNFDGTFKRPKEKIFIKIIVSIFNT